MVFGGEGGGGRFQRSGEAARRFGGSSGHTDSFRPLFLIFTAGGKHPMDGRGGRRCDHYLLKSCIPAIKVDSTLTGRKR